MNNAKKKELQRALNLLDEVSHIIDTIKNGKDEKVESLKDAENSIDEAVYSINNAMQN